MYAKLVGKHVKRGKVQSGMHFTPVSDRKPVCTRSVKNFLPVRTEVPEFTFFGNMYSFSTLDVKTRASQIARSLRQGGHTQVAVYEQLVGKSKALVITDGEVAICAVVETQRKFMDTSAGKYVRAVSALVDVI